MWFGRLTLDPVSGTIVDTTLSQINNELFEADWAEATQRNTRQGCDFHNLWRNTHPDDWIDAGPDPPGR
jgi:hypothetical protein